MVATLVGGGCIALGILAFLAIALVALTMAPDRVPEVLQALNGML